MSVCLVSRMPSSLTAEIQLMASECLLVRTDAFRRRGASRENLGEDFAKKFQFALLCKY